MCQKCKFLEKTGMPGYSQSIQRIQTSTFIFLNRQWLGLYESRIKDASFTLLYSVIPLVIPEVLTCNSIIKTKFLKFYCKFEQTTGGILNIEPLATGNMTSVSTDQYIVICGTRQPWLSCIGLRMHILAQVPKQLSNVFLEKWWARICSSNSRK